MILDKKYYLSYYTECRNGYFKLLKQKTFLTGRACREFFVSIFKD